MCGVLIQAVAFIADIEERIHGWRTYSFVFIVSCAAVVVLLWLTTCVGYRVARHWWLPARRGEPKRKLCNGRTACSQRRPGGPAGSGHEVRRSQSANLREAGRARMLDIVGQIEDLLDVRDEGGTPQQRLDRLKPYFRSKR